MSTSQGIAIGKIKFLKKEQAAITDTAADISTELQNFEDAKAKALDQLKKMTCSRLLTKSAYRMYSRELYFRSLKTSPTSP